VSGGQSDSPRDGHLTWRWSLAIVHRDPTLAEDRPVVAKIDSHRRGELAGPVAQLTKRAPATPRGHLGETKDGAQRADEHGACHALRLADEIEHVVVAVREIHVRGARRAVHHSVASSDPLGRRVAARIVSSEVRFRLDDDAGGHCSIDVRDDNAADQFGRHKLRRAGKELRGKRS